MYLYKIIPWLCVFTILKTILNCLLNRLEAFLKTVLTAGISLSWIPLGKLFYLCATFFYNDRSYKLEVFKRAIDTISSNSIVGKTNNQINKRVYLALSDQRLDRASSNAPFRDKQWINSHIYCFLYFRFIIIIKKIEIFQLM